MVAHVIPSFTDNESFFKKIIGAIDETRIVLSAQYNAMLKEQISLGTRLCSIEKRLENLEIKLDCNIQLDGFSFDLIKTHEQFLSFLQEIQSKKEYRSKIVSIIYTLKKI